MGRIGRSPVPSEIFPRENCASAGRFPLGEGLNGVWPISLETQPR